MNNQYLTQGKKILETGNVRPDRTGTGTRSLFGKTTMTFDLQEGYPLETSKFTAHRLIAEELLWFLSGSTNNKALLKKDVHIWDEWALVDKVALTPDQRRQQLVDELAMWGALNDPEFVAQAIPVFESHEALDQWIEDFRKEKTNVGFTAADFPKELPGPLDGELGPVYGKMWRSWPAKSYLDREGGFMADPTIDQIDELVKGLKSKPYSRRHLVSGWNPAMLPDELATHAENVRNGKQVLPPCHTAFQFYVRDLSPAQIRDRVSPEEWAQMFSDLNYPASASFDEPIKPILDYWKEKGVATQFLDCQLYQR